MVRLLWLLFGMAGLGMFICYIILFVKQLQAKAFVWAVVTVVTLGLGGVVWGWMNLNKHKLRPVMFTWAVLFPLYFSLLSYLMLTGRLALVPPPQ